MSLWLFGDAGCGSILLGIATQSDAAQRNVTQRNTSDVNAALAATRMQMLHVRWAM